MPVIFVIGLPRSGTSLVQKLIHEETGRKSPTFKDFGIDISRIPSQIRELNKTLRTCPDGRVDENSLAEDNDYQGYDVGDYYGGMKEYRAWLETRGDSWVLKSPEHIAHLPELLDLFPEARFIWCLRDLDQTRDSIIEYFQVCDLRWPYDPDTALEEAYRQVATHPEKFDYIDVESIPEWDSARPKKANRFNFWDVQYEVRGKATRVKSSQFKSRYSVV